MQDIKNKVEAVLFTTGRFVTIEELSRLCCINSFEDIKKALEELKQEYNNKNSSLEVLQENDKFKLSIRKQYLYLTTSFLREIEMEKPLQETLALIAYKQPVKQSEIIKIRSNTAYEHVKRLREQSFISSEKYGRTRLLKLTPKFYEYFDVVENKLKEKLNVQTS